MALLAFIIYTRVRIVSMNCVRVYTIERAYARIYMCMHLYPCEFAFVYRQKCKRSFLCAYACVRLHACLRTDLIKTQNTCLHAKYFYTQKHFGFRNFQDVLYTVGVNKI